MHAISAVTLRPDAKYWCGQSMDNQSEYPLEVTSCLHVLCGGKSDVEGLKKYSVLRISRPACAALPAAAVVTYSARDRVKPNRKKTFKGHTVAGGCYGLQAGRLQACA